MSMTISMVCKAAAAGLEYAISLTLAGFTVRCLIGRVLSLAALASYPNLLTEAITDAD